MTARSKRTPSTPRALTARWAFLVGALALIGGGVIVSIRLGIGRANQRRAPVATDVPAVAIPPGPRSWLDGTPLAAGATQTLAVAVILDNAPEAQPQAGLADAPLVFEVPVEGRRTRFLAVVPLDGSAQPIGPVRSARPYFVGLAEALGVPLVHVGGSAAAMRLLRGKGWFHIDQYFDPPFWRDVSRSAPFNVYTAASNLGSFVRGAGWEDRLRTGIVELWMVRDDRLPTNVFPPPLTEGEREGVVCEACVGSRGGGSEALRLPFDAGPYVVEWRYDAQAGVYSRSQDGRSHMVRAGSEERAVTAKNVVVLRVRSRVLDAIGRLEIVALEPPIQPSSAPQIAAVFTGGRRIEGTWNWNVGGSPRFQILQPDGTSIALRPGTTWVEVVDVDFGK